MIIDVHTHAFPDKLAEKALSALAEHSGEYIPHTDGTVAGLLSSMDNAGIDAAIIASIATKPAQAAPILEWSKTIRSPRIIPFGSVHPASPDFRREIAAIREAGLPGIKLHPLYQDFTVDDPALDPFFGAIEEEKLLLLLHAGYDVAFLDDDRARPSRIARRLERNPDLAVIAAHMGGWQFWDEVNSCLAGAPLWMDTSFLREMTPEQLSELAEKHQGRFLFGTDAPWIPQSEELAAVRNLLNPLMGAGEVEKVLGGNARTLLEQQGWNP